MPTIIVAYIAIAYVVMASIVMVQTAMACIVIPANIVHSDILTMLHSCIPISRLWPAIL